MFNPAKNDLINDEMDATDYQAVGNVIELHPTIKPESPDISPDAHPTRHPMSPDVTRHDRLTVAEFCQNHKISSEQFLSIRKKAARKYPAVDFKPVREGSRTYWVQNDAILSQLIDEGEIAVKTEEIEEVEGELVDEVQPLSDGSSLVIRRQSFELALPPLNALLEHEFISIDVSPIQQATEALNADLKAKEEIEDSIALRAHAEKISQKKAQFDLIEALVKQGYTADEAVKIAKGAKNL